MKIFILLCAIVCTAQCACPAWAVGSQPVLRVAVDAHYPPFSDYDAAGNLIGFDVDFAHALCKELKRRCIVKAVPLPSIIPGITAGNIDIAVASMAVNKARKEKVDFTDKYYRSLSIFIMRAGRSRNISPESLRDLRVGAQEGTLQAKYLEEKYGDSIKLITTPSCRDVFVLLQKDGVDVVLVDGLLGYAYLKSDNGVGLEAIGDALDSNEIPDWASIAVSKKQPELREAVNKAIQTMRRNGEYGKINRKYFEFNIY